MGTNEMEFQWRLNWWYRPTQLDDFGTSVADYYDCFCDWKANMELNSCPANEADYVEAFIQNLRCDIRSRLPKYMFSGGLFCAFLAAKLEESMIRIDEAFKKSSADKPVDEMASRVSANCQENLSDDEFSGLEDDGNDSTTAYESSIDQDSENDDCSSAIENEASLEGNAKSSELQELLESDKDGYDSTVADEISIEKADGVYKDKWVQNSEVTQAEFGMVKVAYQVFDETPRPFFVEPKKEISGDVDQIPPIDCVPQVFDPGTSISLRMYNELYNKLFQQNVIATTGETTVFKKILTVQSESKNDVNEVLWGTSISVAAVWKLARPNSTIEREYASLSFSRNELLGVASNQGRYTDIGFMLPLDPLFDCVPQNFDPGSCSLVVLCDIVDLYCMIIITPGEPDHELWISTLLCTFDPGGVSWFRDNCDSLLFTNENQCFDNSCGRAGFVLTFFRNGNAMLIATTCSK